MERDDDPVPPPKLARTAKHQDELNNLGRSWFAEVREQSEHEAAELEEWKRSHRKWAAFNRRSGFSDFESPPSGGDGGSSD
jgi:hypothetical protein